MGFRPLAHLRSTQPKPTADWWMRHCSCDPLGRKNSATSTAQIDQVRPVAHPPKPHSGLGDKVGDLWVAKATHHSPPHSWKCVLNQQQQFAASGECNELRRVAARRVGWRRTARLKEPQKLSPFTAPILSDSGRALPFITTFYLVRPVAHPPEALRAWATRPAT